jgi:serine/threonine protein kinase
MDAPSAVHPTDQTLSSFALGKLADAPAEAVNKHLEECSDCRQRVSEMSSDTFLDRVRDAQGAGKSMFGQSQADGTQNSKARKTSAPPPADTLPPGLADHPDYEIKRELGRGGMGVVYLAHNTLMGRDEVLKVMGRQIMERPGVLDRFIREIRAVAKLRHPNIVAAYHATRLGESIVFAMEYVDGLDLSKMVKSKGALPVGHACNFVYQSALGLQHAHEEGLVHRDIKPANLMLSRKGDKAAVKVLDFGLAKATREVKVDGGLTFEGQALGTPDFIAPEQILDAPSADIRADIYSLGGTLYYLLTGRPPFKANSLYDTYQAHISRAADPLNLVRTEVPSELAALVAKMMAKDPGRRFQTPGEVAQALTPFFKKGNAAFKSPKTDVSQAGRMDAGRPVTGSVSTPTQPATQAEGPAVPAKKAAQPTVAESRWESLIDFRETERPADPTPAVAPIGQPPWVWPSVAVGVLTFGLLAAWMGGVFKVKTPDGVIVLDNVPKDSEILVDGKTITFTWPGVGEPLEIRAVPGQRRIEVKKDGFTTFGEVVTIKADGSEEITVRLEPLVADRLPNEDRDTSKTKRGEDPVLKNEVDSSRSMQDNSDASGFVSLFNGKDLSGWKTHPSQPGQWRVQSGVLIGSGSAASHLYSVRDDYKDFHLRVEARISEDGNSGVYFRSAFGPIWPWHKPTWPNGYEAQINSMHWNQQDRTGSLRAGPDGVPVVMVRDFPVPLRQWFDLYVIAEGNRVVVMVNGRVTAEYIDENRLYTSGHIVLQSSSAMMRTDPQTVVEFRNVEIKELTGATGGTGGLPQ